MTNDIKIINFTFQILRYDIYGNKLSQPAIPVVWPEKDKPAFCQYFTYTKTPKKYKEIQKYTEKHKPAC